jgi:hypothetical protein
MVRSDNRSDNRAVSPRETSFAGKHQELAGDTPASFHKVPLNRREFDHARDPYLSKQLKALEQTEAQRRGDSERTGRGSEMVRLDKPFPELRPAHENAPIRETFNRAWLREQRAARMADYERQREQHRAIEQSNTMEQEWTEKAPAQRGPER